MRFCQGILLLVFLYACGGDIQPSCESSYDRVRFTDVGLPGPVDPELLREPSVYKGPSPEGGVLEDVEYGVVLEDCKAPECFLFF